MATLRMVIAGHLHRFGLNWHLGLLRSLLAAGLVCPIALCACASDDVSSGLGNGGTSGQAGAQNSSIGGSASGGSATATGGAVPLGGTAGEGGSMTGGTTGSGLAGNAGTLSSLDRCPALGSPAGTLLRPPSNGFEADLSGWHTMAGIDAHLSRVQDASGACEGTSYLVCKGSGGADGWDAPIIELTPYLALGHGYQVTLIARFGPGNAPTQPTEVALFSNTVCETPSVGSLPSHDLLVRTKVHTDWVRFSGTFTFSPAFPFTVPECTRITSTRLYLSPNSDQPFALQIDGFEIRDLGPSPNGGAGGVAGAAGSH